MFHELQKKAKAVLKKVNNPGNVYIESSTLRRRSSDIVPNSGRRKMIDDTNINYRSGEAVGCDEGGHELRMKSEFYGGTKALPISGGGGGVGGSNRLEIISQQLYLPNDKSTPKSKLFSGGNSRSELSPPKLTETNKQDKYNGNHDYFLNKIKSIINDDALLSQQNVYTGGWMYLLLVELFALCILMANDVIFLNGVLCGVTVVMLMLVLFFLVTYSHAFTIHDYCRELRTYVMDELRPKTTHIDFSDIPTTGMVQKTLHTYKGWVYLTNEYDPTKLLAEQNPSIAFLSFGKQSLSIYIVAVVPVENKRIKTNNFNVVKHFRLGYSGVEFSLVPEIISRKRFWSKKLPIKLTYSMGTLVSKRLDPFMPCYQKILAKIDNNNPCGPLPGPNQKFNNVTINFDYNGGDIYLFALTGREKERWYRSLRLCVEGGPAARSRTFRDMVEFCTVSADPFSMKIDFINKIKDVLAHYKAINSVVTKSDKPQQGSLKTDSSTPSSTGGNNAAAGMGNKKQTPKDNLKSKTLKTKSAAIPIQLNDEALFDKSAPIDKSLPLSYTSSQNQQTHVINCDAVAASFTTTPITHAAAAAAAGGGSTDASKRGARNDKLLQTTNATPPDHLLTMDYILSSKSTLALNLLAYRLSWDVWREDRWTNAVKTKIQTKINSLKLPPFIKKLTIEQLDLGNQLPVICSNCDPVLDSEGGIWLHLPLVYSGKLSFSFNTQLDVSIYDRLIVKAATTTNDSTQDNNSINLNLYDSSELTGDNLTGKVNDPLAAEFQVDHENADTDFAGNSPAKPHSNSRKFSNDSNKSLGGEDSLSASIELNNYYSSLDDEEHYTNDVGHPSQSQHHAADDAPSDSSKSEMNTMKMDQLLNSKTGKKLYNVVEKLAQSPFVKKIGRTEIAKKMYNAAKNKLSNLNVMLTVNMTSIKGTLVLYIPPPPSDRVWFGFKTQPAVSLQISTKLNTKNIKLPMLIQFIDSKIKSEFKDVLVLPNMEDIYVPLMSADIDYSESEQQ